MPQAELQRQKPIVYPAYPPGAPLPDLRWKRQHELFQMLRAAVHNRVMIAIILVELANRAERDTMLQNILHMIIPPPPLDNLEYVRPHERSGGYMAGYWRKVQANNLFPTIAQAEYRLAVSEYAYSLYGTKGVIVYPDGRQIPNIIHAIAERFRGVRYTTEEDRAERKRRRTVDRMAGAEPVQAQAQHVQKQE